MPKSKKAHEMTDKELLAAVLPKAAHTHLKKVAQAARKKPKK
jgi:hypothetical protein